VRTLQKASGCLLRVRAPCACPITRDTVCLMAVRIGRSDVRTDGFSDNIFGVCRLRDNRCIVMVSKKVMWDILETI
jgi:hypothetical protein